MPRSVNQANEGSGSTATVSRARRQFEARYGFSHGEHELLLYSRDVRRCEALAVREGEAELALYVENPLILVCARFGEAVPWTAAPYCWHLTPREDRVLPPAVGSPEERRILLPVMLLAEGSSVIHARRCITLSLDFTRALHEAISEQARLPFDPHGYDRALSRLRHPLTRTELLLARATARTLGSR